jgi:hypothetical protein
MCMRKKVSTCPSPRSQKDPLIGSESRNGIVGAHQKLHSDRTVLFCRGLPLTFDVLQVHLMFCSFASRRKFLVLVFRKQVSDGLQLSKVVIVVENKKAASFEAAQVKPDGSTASASQLFRGSTYRFREYIGRLLWCQIMAKKKPLCLYKARFGGSPYAVISRHYP